MKIYNIEAVSIATDHQLIAGIVLEMVRDRDFASIKDFDAVKGVIISKACKHIGWGSAPENCGLIVSWDNK